MHVLMVNYSLRRIGGAEIYVLSNMQALLEQGHTVTAVSADSERPPLPEQVGWVGSHDIFCTSMKRYVTALRGAALLSRLLKLARPDVALLHLFDTHPAIRLLERSLPTIRFVHTAWPYCPAGTRWLPSSNRPCERQPGWCCLAINRREGCLTTNAGAPFGVKDSVRRILDMHLQRSFLRSATLVAANSEYTRRQVERFAGADTRIVVLPPPVPRPECQPRDPVPGRVFVAGRLTAAKGVQDAIRAIAPIPGAELRIAGDGPHRPLLERLANELGIRSRVTFLGWVGGDEVNAEMQAAQLVLFLSTWPETFGQVGVQAAHAGRPVIAYDGGGVRDWLNDDTGILVPLGNLMALTAATQALLADPARCKEMGARARATAARFDIPAFRSRMEAAIDQAIAVWKRPQA